MRTLPDRSLRSAVPVAAIALRVATFQPGPGRVGGVVHAADIPGHTPGHSGYLIGSGPRSVLHIDDTMHHFVASVEYPEWRTSFDTDQPRAARSRVTGEPRWVAKRQRIYAVHLPFPGYGIIVREGASYAWRPLPEPTLEKSSRNTACYTTGRPTVS